MFANTPPELDKLFHTSPGSIMVDLSPIHYEGNSHDVAWVIPKGVFTPEEIEVPRNEHELRWECGYGALIANFLPDEVRPKGVTKM